MKTKRLRLLAGVLAGFLIAMNLTLVCFAAENSTEDAEEVETAADTSGEDTDVVIDGETDEDGYITVSLEDLEKLLSENASEDEEITAGTVNVTDGSYLNLRAGAGTDCEIIGHLLTGDELEIVGEDGDWYEVVVKERTGYVYKDYVDVAGQVVSSDQMDEETLTMLMALLMAGMNSTDNSAEADTSSALTPDGNLTLVDDYSEENEDGSGKQFITVTTKDGNYFYLIIDRDEDGTENVHFMNLVDEADLLALMDEDEAAQYTEQNQEQEEEPTVTEPEQTEEPEETEPVEETEEKSSVNVAPIILLVLLLCGGGGYFAYTKFFKVKKRTEQEKPDPDADYLDGGDDTDFDVPDDVAADEEDESTMFDAEDNEPV